MVAVQGKKTEIIAHFLGRYIICVLNIGLFNFLHPCFLAFYTTIALTTNFLTCTHMAANGTALQYHVRVSRHMVTMATCISARYLYHTEMFCFSAVSFLITTPVGAKGNILAVSVLSIFFFFLFFLFFNSHCAMIAAFKINPI